MLHKNYWKKVVYGIFFLLLLAVPTLAAAQNGVEKERESKAVNLFGPVSAQTMSAQAENLLAVYAAQATTLAIEQKQVQVVPLLKATAINLNLFPNETMIFNRELLEVRGTEDFSWFGQPVDGEGFAVLTVQGQDMVATIQKGGQRFSVYPLGNGLHAVMQVDAGAFPPEDDEWLEEETAVSSQQISAPVNAITPGESEEGIGLLAMNLPEEYDAKTDDPEEAFLDVAQDSSENAFEEGTTPNVHPMGEANEPVQADLNAPAPNALEDSGHTITVLAAFTPAAAAQLLNPSLLAQNAVDIANMSYRNSNILPRLYLLDTYTTSYIETGNLATDVLRLRRKADGFMDEVHGRRDTVAADVVLLLTSSAASSTKCGRAAAVGATPVTAFAVVLQNCAAANYTLAHEVGHLQGAGHNQEQDNGSPYPYGHGYIYPAGGWRTIMAYPCPSTPCTRIPYWSNPNIRYGGVPMGTDAISNNARVLNETASQVASFRTTPVGGQVEAGDRFGSSLGHGDFDGDGYSDLAVGVPGESIGSLNNAGAVNIFYSTAGGLSTVNTQIWHQNSAGVLGIAEENDRLGAALTAGDFNGDGYADLAIGVPYESVDSAVGAGAVNVLYGSAEGLLAAGNQIWHQQYTDIEGRGEAYDRFGTAVTSGDFNGDGYDDLAVGVPGEDLNAGVNAGVVNVLYGSFTGLTANGNQMWHQNMPGIVGISEAGDNFGAALAAGDFNFDGRDDLAIGVPDEGIDTVIRAGAVNILYGHDVGLTAGNNQIWHQNIANIEGRAENGDHFGAALAAGRFDTNLQDDLAVGVPGESIGTKQGAGAVNVIYGSGSGLQAAYDDLWHQDVAGIQGMAEPYDGFGAALAAGKLNWGSTDDLVIGVPGEAIEAINQAGAINVLLGGTGGLTTLHNQLWYQDSESVLDDSEANDLFGRAVAAADFNGDGFADVAIGVPGETLFDKPNAGAVNVLRGSNGGLTSEATQFWHQDS